MNREVHVRFREHLRGKFPWVTRPPVSQLEPGSGKTHKAYLWAYRSNDLQNRTAHYRLRLPNGS